MRLSKNDDDLVNMAGMLLHGDPSAYIDAQVAIGQRQVVRSAVIPTRRISPRERVGTTAADIDAEFMAIGIRFGEVVADDPLFQEVTVPDGWSRGATAYPLWSELRDERGVARVLVFYNAAFSDRRAFCRLVEVGAELASGIELAGANVAERIAAVPWDVLTSDERAGFLDTLGWAEMRARADLQRCDDGHYDGPGFRPNLTADMRAMADEQLANLAEARVLMRAKGWGI